MLGANSADFQHFLCVKFEYTNTLFSVLQWKELNHNMLTVQTQRSLNLSGCRFPQLRISDIHRKGHNFLSVFMQIYRMTSGDLEYSAQVVWTSIMGALKLTICFHCM